MSALTPAQRQQAINLYKRVIKTSRQTFAGDQATSKAWKDLVRKEFEEGKLEKDIEKVQQNFTKWEDVIKVLQQNVVQGELNDQKSAFTLKFKPETELGSNESIRQAKQKQLDDLRANKGKSPQLACGGGSRAFSTSSFSGSAFASTSSSQQLSQTRPYSTSPIVHAAKVTRNWAREKPDTQLWETDTIPRPVPKFGTLTVLSDGSTIQLHNTSPRGVTRLTRDPTNHPLWNPKSERGRGGMGDEDESGRLARFRRRFGGAEDRSAESNTKATSTSTGSGKGKTASAPTTSSRSPSRAGFSEDDFEWMSVGGREARGKNEEPVKKGGAGKKGKK